VTVAGIEDVVAINPYGPAGCWFVYTATALYLVRPRALTA
jgi:hypothetical protein